ncbi:unnamed protein product [Amoebophrya sp. A25]|nr:unnamed protein product [Amoebophrya sp. A25]|eukprot:GSA25T00013053001.1
MLPSFARAVSRLGEAGCPSSASSALGTISSSCSTRLSGSGAAIFAFQRYDTRGPKCVLPKDMIQTWKLAPGDDVKVLSGKDKSKEGVVLAVDKRRNMVKVKGCNMQTLKDKEGKKVRVERKIHYSNINLLDPVTREATRVGLHFQPDGAILRVSKKSGQVIPWPERQFKRFDTEMQVTHEKDTEPADALEKTYCYHRDVQASRLARQSMTKYNHDT